jgi:hypothetical protein
MNGVQNRPPIGRDILKTSLNGAIYIVKENNDYIIFIVII